MLDVASRILMGLIRGAWNGDGQPLRPYRGLKLVFLMAGWADIFQK